MFYCLCLWNSQILFKLNWIDTASAITYCFEYFSPLHFSFHHLYLAPIPLLSSQPDACCPCSQFFQCQSIICDRTEQLLWNANLLMSPSCFKNWTPPIFYSVKKDINNLPLIYFCVFIINICFFEVFPHKQKIIILFPSNCIQTAALPKFYLIVVIIFLSALSLNGSNSLLFIILLATVWAFAQACYVLKNCMLT